ncbi:hypothetical protein [Streptomyces sp. NEAU-YJ-81]|uniref:hypothetical protein n=1 Tax=Streptomyces sp. NEAU-YJ-81 TaxID=2820288 RepID=UPI001ABC0857|nr:hypothetical protein [Streptomyces sp. NEAU-YJ-81]MBO3673874.1 hypothetical protein [Streptomyces sp. NEAU-YJ-81]
MSDALYVRFQGTVRSPRGHFPGVFARAGQLSDEEHRFWRAGNDWFNANFANPSEVDPSVYDPALNPGAVAWFKAASLELIARVDGYLKILALHEVACERIESSNPGKIIYEDPDQVVVTPWAHDGAGPLE